MTKAADGGGFEHPGSAVMRAPLELDETGMAELSELLRDTLDRAREINLRAVERRSADATIASTSTELAILHFERPA